MFLNYIHNFRGIAILFIVAQHCMDSFHWKHDEMTYHLLAFIIRDGTSLFMFISGFLFQYLSCKYDYKTYMKNKARHIILPYIVVSLPAIILFTFIRQRHDLGSDFYAYSIPIRVLLFYLTGSHITAFWFIPMITVYYILSPVFIQIDRHKWIYYLIPLFIVLSILIPISENVFGSFIGYIPDYLLGMFCSRYRNSFLNMNDHYIKLCVLIYLSFIGVYLSGVQFGLHVQPLNYLGKLLLSILFITLLYRYDHKIKIGWSYPASVSLGIYFIHSYMIQILRFFISGSIGGLLPGKGSVIPLFLFFIVVIIITSLIIELIKKISGKYSRYMIGC